ncbi:MAG: inorganic diphosphatase [Planctomycetes bacterium]|nr:inorganic diphosphatase [Planctomycetota bacterium]
MRLRTLSLFYFALPALAQEAKAVAPTQDPAPVSTVPLAPGLSFADSMTIRSPIDFLRGPPIRPAEGLVSAVVEIPTGATEKWEVKLDGVMRWDIKNGKPRFVQYLGYPANYGIVPRALLGRDQGGDGDPLDILVLGPSLPRGTVIAVKVLGTIRLIENGEKDDKLIAVTPDSPLADADSVGELDEKYPGITSILQTWFEGYKGPGALTCKGFGGRDEAAALIQASEKSFATAEAAAKEAAKNAPTGKEAGK